MPDPTTRDQTRDHDLVLVGGTGFTGRLTADYLARHAPSDLRWALAGRDQARLERLRDELAAVDPALAGLPLVTADVSDARAVRRVADSARVVATTVGPYLQYGEPLVGACAAAGTDYLDLAGEPEFVDRMYLAHHATAVRSGARLVHSCGFDSVPHDLGVRFTVQELQRLSGVVPSASVTVRGVVRSNATLSGGTLASAVGQIARGPHAQRAAVERRRLEGRTYGRRVRAVRGRPRRDPDLGYWLLPLPTIDPAVVVRSAAADPSYGTDFRYSHYAGFLSPATATGAALGTLGLVAAAQLRPARRLLLERVLPGDGPSEERRSRSWFTVDFVAVGDGTRVRTRVEGGDPGYTETAMMLAESALCLALDDNPQRGGQVTPATAMGDQLQDRLVAAGMTFSVIQG